MTRIALISAAIAISTAAAVAQSETAPKFEVASVRESKPIPMRAGPMLEQSGRLYTINLPLRTLVAEAYGLDQDQVLGGPSWIDSTGFDIEARAGVNATPGQARRMMRELLIERFALSTHAEKRQLPIYELTTASRDGKRAPRLRPSGSECAPPTLPDLGPGGPPPPPPPPALAGLYLGADRREPIRCPTIFFTGHISARAISMDGLAEAMTHLAGRPVVNRTGLAGAFDFDLTYTPDFDAGPRGAAPPPSSAPALFTAVREQLGLRLESARGLVEVLVIDRAERPTEN